MKRLLSMLLVVALTLALTPVVYSSAEGTPLPEVRDEIPEGEMSQAEIIMDKDTYVYNGFFAAPIITVLWGGKRLLPDVDYEVIYDKDPNVGTHTVTIRGKYKLVGSVNKTYTITPLNIINFDMPEQTLVYTGKKIEPFLNMSGYDYSVTYNTNAIDVGTHSLTVNFKGNYSGSVTKEFDIVPQAPKAIKQTKLLKDGFTLSWDKVKGASYYKVKCWGKEKKAKKNSFTYKDKNKDVFYYSAEVCTVCVVGGKEYKSLTNGNTAYKLPVKPKFSLQSVEGGFLITTGNSNAMFQYQYCKNKKFKKLNSRENSNSSFSSGTRITDTDFKTGGTRYVRIRMVAYCKKYVYSKWSKIKKVKIG